MLDGITDVRNIGAIARRALCCGAQALIIPDKGVGALNAEAVKSSAGALEHIHVCRVNSLIKAVDTLHLNGIQVFTSEMRADKKIFELTLTDPCCVIMGDEGKGVQPYLAKAADAFFCESAMAALAAAMFNSISCSTPEKALLVKPIKVSKLALLAAITCSGVKDMFISKYLKRSFKSHRRYCLELAFGRHSCSGVACHAF